MAFFEWDMSLDVGVAAMNDQHKHLISLMDIVHQKNLSGASKQEILVSVQTMVDFVLKHFKDEEIYMESVQFPGLDVHKKLHSNLLADLTKFIENFQNSSANRLGDEFTIFLKFWLATHIRGIDSKYGTYSKGNL